MNSFVELLGSLRHANDHTVLLGLNMMHFMQWPDRFHQMLRGIDCPMCAGGRPEETNDGVRYFSGEVTDAYMRRTDLLKGLSVVIWRGRHVAEPTELSDDEAFSFFKEVLIAGRAIERAFKPLKMNYNLLGNWVPHLHMHIVPRYENDPKPGWPFPFPDPEPPPMPADELDARLEALRASIQPTSQE